MQPEQENNDPVGINLQLLPEHILALAEIVGSVILQHPGQFVGSLENFSEDPRNHLAGQAMDDFCRLLTAPPTEKGGPDRQQGYGVEDLIELNKKIHAEKAEG